MSLQEQLEHIYDHLKADIDKALEREVLDAVRKEEISTIEDVVYDAYDPLMYRRRGDYGGMADPYNIEGEVEDGQLRVVNTTEPNSKYASIGSKYKNLPKLIEYGHGGPGGRYDFPRYGAGYMKPRRFTQQTKERLQKTGAHKDALEDGLNRLGIKTK